MSNSVTRLLSYLISWSLPILFIGFVALLLLSLGMVVSPDLTADLIPRRIDGVMTIYELISPGLAIALSLFLIVLLLTMTD